MKLLALTIGGGGGPTFNIGLPSQIQTLSNLSLQNIVTFALQLLLFAAILLSFVFVLIGGMKWMLSQGDKKQVEEAQKTVTFAIVGLILSLLSFFLINLVGYLFQVPLGG